MSLTPSAGTPPQLPVVPAAKPVAFPDGFTAPFSTPGQQQVATFKSLPLWRRRPESPQGQSHTCHMWSRGDLMTRTSSGSSTEPLGPQMREAHPAPGRPSPLGDYPYDTTSDRQHPQPPGEGSPAQAELTGSRARSPLGLEAAWASLLVTFGLVPVLSPDLLATSLLVEWQPPQCPRQ